jgi:hypothetical protein
MSNAFNFNAASVEPARPREYDVVPKGWYRAHIIAAAMKDAKKAGNKFAELEFSVLDPEFKGRRVWTRLSIVNSTAEAQDIALRDLSAICHATGVLKMQFLDQLMHKPLMIYVIVEPAKGEYKEKNEIKGYKGAEQNGQPTRQAVATVAAEDDVDNGEDDDLPF